MERVVSTRLDESAHKRFLEKCSQHACTRSDLLKELITHFLEEEQAVTLEVSKHGETKPRLEVKKDKPVPKARIVVEYVPTVVVKHTDYTQPVHNNDMHNITTSECHRDCSNTNTISCQSQHHEQCRYEEPTCTANTCQSQNHCQGKKYSCEHSLI